jgi:hypothetical protein
MIGTPNLGSPAATATVDYASIAILYYPMLYPYLIEFYCFPALNDLVEGSEASEAEIQTIILLLETGHLRLTLLTLI